MKDARIQHRRATPVGGSVEITANPSRGVAGSRLTFDVQAIDGSGQLVAGGQIDRAIVHRQRFLASVSADAGHQ
jgi:fluoroacetyl-CoA thioesterase